MFADYLKSEEILFKHALGCRDIYGKEFHIFNEAFLLIGDTAKFTSDHIITEIGPDTLVLIPKNQFHQFDHIGLEENYHRYVLQFDRVEGLNEVIDEVVDKVKIFNNLSPKTVGLFKKLEVLVDDNKSQVDKEKLLKAIFTEILIDLKYSGKATVLSENITDKKVEQIINYVNENFLNEISVSSIAKSLNFSETYISHRFKEVMHISIYKYILQKKLMYAHKLISEGTGATDAAFACGFNEYSGFYRVYKKYFGWPPSKTNK